MIKVAYPFSNNSRRAKQIKKYSGEQCCVCNRWGAKEPFGEPLRALILFAQTKRLTLKNPGSKAVHDKCLRQLKTLTNLKRSEV